MGGIAYAGRTQLVVLNFKDNGPGHGLTARRYTEQLLRPLVVPCYGSASGVPFSAV